MRYIVLFSSDPSSAVRRRQRDIGLESRQPDHYREYAQRYCQNSARLARGIGAPLLAIGSRPWFPYVVVAVVPVLSPRAALIWLRAVENADVTALLIAPPP